MPERSLVPIPDSSPRQIWLIGGTQESVTIARSLVELQLPCLITVTTESARWLYPDSPMLTLRVGQLQDSDVPDLLQTHRIVAIVDASHPFAVAISQLAIAGAAHHNIPYLRFERSQVGTLGVSSQQPPGNWIFPTFEALLATERLMGQRVLLTVGYRALELFRPWQEKATLFARILPSVTALEGAIAAGFTPDRLIALRPPITAELEQALWRQWRITTVVTKASGTAGGEDVKRQVAAQLGIQLMTIARPEMRYPQHTEEVAIVLQFCQQHLRPIRR